MMTDSMSIFITSTPTEETMNKINIEPGMKCFTVTNLSRAKLLCTIESIQGDMLTLKLPCILKGYSHVQMHVKDVDLKQQSEKPKQEKIKAPGDENNPYRRHLDNLLRNPIPKPAPKPAPQVSPQNENGDTPDLPGDLLRITLVSMSTKERREYIEELGEAGKEYHDLLREKP